MCCLRRSAGDEAGYLRAGLAGLGVLVLFIIVLLSFCGGEPVGVVIDEPAAVVEVSPSQQFSLVFEIQGSEHLVGIGVESSPLEMEYELKASPVGGCRGGQTGTPTESHRCEYLFEAPAEIGTYEVTFTGTAVFAEVWIDDTSDSQAFDHVTTVHVVEEPTDETVPTTLPDTTAVPTGVNASCSVGDRTWTVSPTTYESIDGTGANVMLSSSPPETEPPEVSARSLPPGVTDVLIVVEPSGDGAWRVLVGALTPWPEGEHALELAITTAEGQCVLGFTTVVSSYSTGDG